MNQFIPVNEPLLDGNEKLYLNECIDTGWISSEGPFVKRFESEFASRNNRKYGIAVANGTAAIDIAIQALGISAGDEVILPTFTIISCIQQIVRVGATPILVDANPITFSIDVSQVEQKITKSTKAIMVVHIYGHPVELTPILNLCDKYKLLLIEDSAEMIGQTYKNEPCGSFGDISIFSFYPNKHITTGEGGMIITNNYSLAEKCKSFRNLCFKPHKRFVHTELGWNYRMSNIQAAIGVAQLERLDEFVTKKRFIGNLYNELLGDVPFITLPVKYTSYSENIYWVYTILLDNNAPISAEEVCVLLQKEGIGTRPFFYPLHLQPVFSDYEFFKSKDFPVSEILYDNGFYIPSGLNLTVKQITRVADSLRKILTF